MEDFIDRDSMTDEEWYKFVRHEMGAAIDQQNKTIAQLKRELQKKNDAIEAVRLSHSSKKKTYLPQPIGKIGTGEAKDWCHAVTDKTFEARLLAEKMVSLDVSSRASVDDEMFALDVNEFHAWALAVAEIVTLCTSWLDNKGVGEVARAALYQEINERVGDERWKILRKCWS